MTEGFEPPACLACPGRPARVRGLGLCSRHQQRWERHRDRGALPAGIEAWAALQDAFPGYGTCQTSACSRLATTPLGLCGFHERSYAEAGRPGGAGLPALWVRRCEEQGLPVPVGNLQEFRRWCARAGAAFNPGQVSLAGLRPLAKAELQWGMEAHARPREHTKWCVPWLRELARLCRDGDLDCLADIDLSACPSRIRMIVGEILNRLRVVYYTKDDSRQAGFIETDRFGRQAAEAMAVSIGRRCTPALGGLCTEQVVVDGGRCPKKNKLDCDNCDKLVMTGADLLYWRRKREQWHSIAERAPDDATAGYLHSVFEPTARAIDGLEKALAGLGLLDQALALDLRRPQDYFRRLWNTGFPVPALSAITGATETETA